MAKKQDTEPEPQTGVESGFLPDALPGMGIGFMMVAALVAAVIVAGVVGVLLHDGRPRTVAVVPMPPLSAPEPKAEPMVMPAPEPETMPRADDAAMPPAGDAMPEEGKAQGPDTEPAMETPSEKAPKAIPEPSDPGPESTADRSMDDSRDAPRPAMDTADTADKPAEMADKTAMPQAPAMAEPEKPETAPTSAPPAMPQPQFGDTGKPEPMETEPALEKAEVVASPAPTPETAPAPESMPTETVEAAQPPTPALPAPAPSEREMAALPAERMVVTRRSNLRAEPSPSAAIVGKVEKGATIERLDPQPRLGYFRVIHDGTEGWLWWRNVEAGG